MTTTDVKDRTCFLVRLREGGSMVLEGESFQPIDRAAYVQESFWECISYRPFEPDSNYAVFSSGTVHKQVFRNGEELVFEEVGYVPSLLLADRQEREREELLHKGELAFQAWSEGAMPGDLYSMRQVDIAQAEQDMVRRHAEQSRRLRKIESRLAPYPQFCIHPQFCLGLGCCQRSYSCVE